MEPTEVKRDRWYRSGKIATSLAALMLVLSTNDNDPLDKPEGPYKYIETSTSWGAPPLDSPRELPAEFVPVIRLTDTLDGRLTTRGFQVFIEEWYAARDLEQNAVAVFKQPHSVDDEASAIEVVFASQEARQRMSKFLRENPKVLEEFRSLTHNVDNVGYDFLGQSHDAAGGRGGEGLVAIGRGLEEHFDSQAEIIYSKYIVKSSGLDLVSQESTFVERIPNVKCDGIDMQASVEVELTSRQRKVVCYVMERFGLLADRETTLTLDSSLSRALHSYENNDVLLSYPYVDGKEVSHRTLKIVALHEMMHAAYMNVVRDPELRDEVEHVYADVVSTMRYQVPSRETQAESGITVGEVEPVWGVIAEGRYPGENTRHGHPWDNPTEMISSAASVLAFHPDDFIERFKELTEKQQIALLQVVGVVGEVVETTDASISKVIPDYQTILAQLREIVGQS